VVRAQAQCVDNDGDGYCSVATGGDDCEDLMSAYKIQTSGPCRETSPPTFLKAPLLYPEDPQRIQDHAWIQSVADNTFHLFPHNTDTANTPGAIRHFVASSDLTSLQTGFFSTAITSTPGTWDKDGLWAPHIIYSAGKYYMFYTGVSLDGNGVYQIGLATSTDLYTWTKKANPVYNCETDAPWVETGSVYSHHCRDPFVIRDEANGRWLMFATSLLKSPDPALLSEGVVVASTTDLENGPWISRGYIKATRTLAPGDGIGQQLSNGHTSAAENPFVTYAGGSYYLFFSDWRDPECDAPGNIQSSVQYAVSDSLSVDGSGSTNWKYRGAIPDPGVNAAEILLVGGDTWVMSARVFSCFADPSQVHCPAGCQGLDPPHVEELRLKRIIWDGKGGFTTANLTRLTCRVPSITIHPGAYDPCDSVDQDCDPCTTGCGGGGGHGIVPTE
jgi:beta-xylosidase